jgi:hypothetical protein
MRSFFHSGRSLIIMRPLFPFSLGRSPITMRPTFFWVGHLLQRDQFSMFFYLCGSPITMRSFFHSGRSLITMRPLFPFSLGRSSITMIPTFFWVGHPLQRDQFSMFFYLGRSLITMRSFFHLGRSPITMRPLFPFSLCHNPFLGYSQIHIFSSLKKK